MTCAAPVSSALRTRAQIGNSFGVEARCENRLRTPVRVASVLRPSLSHFGKPPSRMSTSRAPNTRSVHQTRGAEAEPCTVIDDDPHAIADAEA